MRQTSSKCQCNNTSDTTTGNNQVIAAEPSETMALNQQPSTISLADDTPDPLEDNPPQYDAVVPPRDGTPANPQNYQYRSQNDGALYPPQGVGALYPPHATASYPPDTGSDVAYPPQASSAPYQYQDSSSAPYPPQGSASNFEFNPAFPPADYIPDTSNNDTPLTPPPSYDSLSTANVGSGGGGGGSVDD